MNFRREKRLKVKALFDITPLVNVVLLLLFFFMLSSTFTVTASIPIEAAKTDARLFFEEKDISITLLQGEGGPDNEGQIFINDDEIAAWDDLSTTLNDLHQQEPDAVLLIRPEANVSSARLVRIMGIATSLGIDRYAIAAEGGAGQ
jgi:biopolymer transport protein ExbD